MSCPLCGGPALVLFSSVECENLECRNGPKIESFEGVGGDVYHRGLDGLYSRELSVLEWMSVIERNERQKGLEAVESKPMESVLEQIRKHYEEHAKLLASFP